MTDACKPTFICVSGGCGCTTGSFACDQRCQPNAQPCVSTSSCGDGYVLIYPTEVRRVGRADEQEQVRVQAGGVGVVGAGGPARRSAARPERADGAEPEQRFKKAIATMTPAQVALRERNLNALKKVFNGSVPGLGERERTPERKQERRR
jgi:hypothetical protein